MKKLTRFLANAWHELKRVKWPSLPQAMRYTITVIFVVTFFAVFSYALQALMAFIVDKIA
ncbi:MAG: preprotein translocase subunit SecE [Bacilli bacterium]